METSFQKSSNHFSFIFYKHLWNWFNSIFVKLNFYPFFIFLSIVRPQACPVDLTRTIPPTTPNTDKNTCRKLAFSVENILDPNKFCSRKENHNSTRLWLNNGFERDDRNQMDDDQSESQSGDSFCFIQNSLFHCKFF